MKFKTSYEIIDYFLNVDNYKTSRSRGTEVIYADSEEELLEEAVKLTNQYGLRSSLIWQYTYNGTLENPVKRELLSKGTYEELDKEFNYDKYYMDCNDIFFEPIELISDYTPKIDLNDASEHKEVLLVALEASTKMRKPARRVNETHR